MNRNLSDEERRFGEYVRIVSDGKFVILGALAIFWLCALLLNVLLPTVYESQAVFSVGHKYVGSGRRESIAGNPGVYDWLNKTFPTAESSRSGDGPYVYKLRSHPSVGEWKVIWSRAASAKAAQDFLSEVLAAMLQRHELIYRESLQPLQQDVALIESQIQELQHRIDENKQRIEQLIAKEPSLAVVAMVQQNELSIRMQEKREQLHGLKAEEARFLQSAIVSAPTLPANRTSPDTRFLISVATVLGLIIGWIGAVAMRRKRVV